MNTLPSAAAEFWIANRIKLRSQRKGGADAGKSTILAPQPISLASASSTLTAYERECGLRILFHMRFYVRKKRMEMIKFQILLKLVLFIQRKFRNRRERRLRASPPPLVALAPESPVENTGFWDSVITTKQVPHDVHVPEMADSESFAFSAETIHSIIKTYKAQQKLMRLKGVVLVNQIAEETVTTADRDTGELPDDRAETGVELEPVDILLPKNVPGMLQSGTIVTGPLAIVGKSIEHTPTTEWVVDEVEDVEELHVFDGNLDKAAKRIQKFYRRYRTRHMLKVAVERAILEIRNDIRTDEIVETANPDCVIM